MEKNIVIQGSVSIQESSILGQTLTCNRIFRHLFLCCQKGFSGRLKIRGMAGEVWHIYLTNGNLTWAAGGIHPKRRWQRQMLSIEQQEPDFSGFEGSEEEGWDYSELSRLANKHQLSPSQIGKVVGGVFGEILFEIVQAFEQPLHLLITEQHPLVDISALTGVGDGIQVEAEAGISVREGHRFPQTLMPDIEQLQQQTQAAWETWVQLGLCKFSPNLAPSIREPETLRALVSAKTYRNLTTLLNGERTLRDIVLQAKPNCDLLSVARYISPYSSPKSSVKSLPGIKPHGFPRAAALSTRLFLRII